MEFQDSLLIGEKMRQAMSEIIRGKLRTLMLTCDKEMNTYHSVGGFSAIVVLFLLGLFAFSGEFSTSNTLSMSASKNEFKAL